MWRERYFDIERERDTEGVCCCVFEVRKRKMASEWRRLGVVAQRAMEKERGTGLA